MFWMTFTRFDLSQKEKIETRAEQVCLSELAYKPDSATPVLSGGRSQNSSKLLWEDCGRKLLGLSHMRRQLYKILTKQMSTSEIKK